VTREPVMVMRKVDGEDRKVVVFEEEMAVTKIVGKFTAPDTTACIFWLCNRDGENWKHRYALEGSREHAIPFKLVIDHDCDRD